MVYDVKLYMYPKFLDPRLRGKNESIFKITFEIFVQCKVKNSLTTPLLMFISRIFLFKKINININYFKMVKLLYIINIVTQPY